jgi:hypothetical protein
MPGLCRVSDLCVVSLDILLAVHKVANKNILIVYISCIMNTVHVLLHPLL